MGAFSRVWSRPSPSGSVDQPVGRLYSHARDEVAGARHLPTGLRWQPTTAPSTTGPAGPPTRAKEIIVSKRTFQPNTRRRAKTHGFRLRMRTRAGRAILANRRRKGRTELSA